MVLQKPLNGHMEVYMNMLKIFHSFYCCLLFAAAATAQRKPLFNPTVLSITWQFMGNHFNGADKHAALLTIANNGSQPLPTTGWAIYFNAVRPIAPGELPQGLAITLLKGDLFRLSPTKAFVGLGARKQLNIQLTGDYWIYNISEVPRGFYFVWDQQPDAPVALAPASVKLPNNRKAFAISADTNTAHITPAMVFEQNSHTTLLPAEQLPRLFPTPAHMAESNGSLPLGYDMTIVAGNFATEAAYLGTQLKKLLSASGNPLATGSSIQLLTDPSLGNEAYTLTIDASGVKIAAAQGAGIFYGIQSLLNLLPPNSRAAKAVALPFVRVADYPRFAYRGLHIDVARNFQPKAQVLKMLDLMALYKLNVLHFHFSDDEGWRIEIPGLPELTTVGAIRKHRPNYGQGIQPTYGSGGPENPAQSGYYSRQDYIDILQYAKQRHIEVMPEIETPGHARAAILAMKARHDRLMAEGRTTEAKAYLLHELGDSSNYTSVQNYSDNVMAIGQPSVYRFLEKVVDELMLMHREAGSPLTTLHMGGDEVPAGTWAQSPSCQALLAANKEYKNAADLWRWYWLQVHQLLSKKGVGLAGWEEMSMRPTKLDGNPLMVVNPEFAAMGFTAYVWNNVIGFGSEDLPYRLANGGYKVVLCPVSNLYFDLAYQKDFYEPGYYWGGFVDVDKPFRFIPFDYYKNTKQARMGEPINASYFACKERLTEYGKQNILGIQGHLWSENITSPELMEYMAFPKMLGLAERAWAPDPDWATEKDSTKSQQLYQQAWNNFANTLGQRELPRLAYFQNGVQYRIPPPGAKIEGGKVWANTQFPGLTICYTINGIEPTVSSPKYEGPIAQKGKILLRCFDAKGRGSRTVGIDNE